MDEATVTLKEFAKNSVRLVCLMYDRKAAWTSCAS